MKRQALSAFGIVVAMAVTPVAAASEVCVTCSGPPAIYRCTVDEASRIEGYRHSKRVLQLACITELAREGGHEKCSVRRTSSDDICFGQERQISIIGSLDALAERAQTEAEVEGVPQALTGIEQPPPEQPKKAGPPKTVEELAQRTASASKEKLEKTGDSLGKAVKKGWGCLASLFQDC